MTPQDSEKIAAGLRSLAAHMRDQQPPAELETALRFAFRRRRQLWRRISFIAAGAAAASILFAVAILMQREAPEIKSPVTIARAPQQGLKQKAVEQPPPAVVRRMRPSRRAQLPPREVVTEFFPVAGGDLLGPLDRGGIVRIRIPRSALTFFGLPMNEARATELIKADVVMGEDGLARAIRFVQ